MALNLVGLLIHLTLKEKVKKKKKKKIVRMAEENNWQFWWEIRCDHILR